MNKLLLGTMLLMGSLSVVQAQDNRYLTGQDSDPEATALLDRMEAFLNENPRIKVDFTMTMAYPNQDPMTYEGTFEQDGYAFRVDVGSYRVVSDGVTRWVYLPEPNEVNIYNVDPTEGPVTPLDQLLLYQKEDFVYAITGQEGSVSLIEFKPLDKHSDFSKLRLHIQSADARPAQMELFEKDGSRVVLNIKNVAGSAAFPPDYFKFVIADHPGVRVEDLRID